MCTMTAMGVQDRRRFAGRLALVMAAAGGLAACSRGDASLGPRGGAAGLAEPGGAAGAVGHAGGPAGQAGSAGAGNGTSGTSTSTGSAEAGGGGGQAGEGGSCVLGEVESRPCGSCGRQWRVCGEGTDWGYCDGEYANPECSPNDQYVVACSACGSASYWCSDASCTWQRGACVGERLCTPGESKVYQGSCPTGTFAVKPCLDTCWFSTEGTCIGPPRADAVDLLLRGYFPLATGGSSDKTALFAVDPEHDAPPVMLPIRAGGNVAVSRFGWSFDGRWVAFRAKEYASDRLFLVDLSAEAPGPSEPVGSTRTSADFSTLRLAWSPVANHLAFMDPGIFATSTGAAGEAATTSVPRHLAIVRMEGDVNDPVPVSGDLAVEDADAFRWSPSGSFLALSTDDGKRLHVLDATGAAPPATIVEGADPVVDFLWSTTGDTLVWFTQDAQELTRADPTLVGAAIVVAPEVVATSPAQGVIREVLWTPDGTGLLARTETTLPSDGTGSATLLSELQWLDLTLPVPIVPVALPSYGSVTRFQARGSRVFFSANDAVWVLGRDELDVLAVASVAARRVPDATDLGRHVYGTQWDASADGARLVFAGNIERWDLPEVYHLDLEAADAAPVRLAPLSDLERIIDLRFGGAEGRYVAYRTQSWTVANSCESEAGEYMLNRCPDSHKVCNAETQGRCAQAQPLELFVVPFANRQPSGPALRVHQPDPAPANPLLPSPFEPVAFEFRP